jgi:hypothetical protein
MTPTGKDGQYASDHSVMFEPCHNNLEGRICDRPHPKQARNPKVWHDQNGIQFSGSNLWT